MATEPNKDIAAIFREGVLIDRALEAATREAIQKHKQAGQPMVVSRNGKIVLISPEELEANLQSASSKK